MSGPPPRWPSASPRESAPAIQIMSKPRSASRDSEPLGGRHAGRRARGGIDAIGVRAGSYGPRAPTKGLFSTRVRLASSVGEPAPCPMAFRKARHAASSVSLLCQCCVPQCPLRPCLPPMVPAAGRLRRPPRQAPAGRRQGPRPPRHPGERRPTGCSGPIALYPDPLLALILPASTVPGDISAASAYLVQYGDMTRIDSQPWDPSVRALAHYPAIVTWMAENIEWTQAVGSAFLSSPAEVMASIQRLRARALASGALGRPPSSRSSSRTAPSRSFRRSPNRSTHPPTTPTSSFPTSPTTATAGRHGLRRGPAGGPLALLLPRLGRLVGLGRGLGRLARARRLAPHP